MGLLKSMIGNIVAKTMARKLKNSTITEDDIKPLLREIRIALLDADVNLTVVKKFINDVKDQTVGQILDENLAPSEFVLNIIKQELIKILGTKQAPLVTDKKINKYMLVGLNGAGKTTTAAKIANQLKNVDNKKPMLVGLDIYRPAAIEQLRQLASDIHVDFYENGTNPVTQTARTALELADQKGDNLVIFDTAGRLQTNQELMDELVDIKKAVQPDEILLVVDAMSGQDIINVAQQFHDCLKLTGIVITKLDSDARAGAALSLAALLNVPIKLSGVGEKIGSLDVFYPERIADRILGLGDIVSLAEKAADQVDERAAKGMLKRMLAGKMDLEDLMKQMKQMSGMGSLGSIIGMLPGMDDKISDDQIGEAEEKIRVWQILLSSMTLKERRNPALFKKQPNRRARVIKGSGRKPEELNKLLKQWEVSSKKMAELGRQLQKGVNPFNKNFKDLMN